MRHYYWMPKDKEWPQQAAHVSKNLYGSQFAYLLYKYRLKNAYFTNIVKCSLGEKKLIPFYVVRDKEERDTRIREMCYRLFLSEELRICKPSLVFYFGKRAKRMGDYLMLKEACAGAQPFELCHPAARMSGDEIVQQNERIIQEALDKLKR